MSTLNNWPSEATNIQDGDLMPLKRGTGVNSDKRITGANVKLMFASAAQGALADTAIQLEDTDLIAAMYDVEVPVASQAEAEAGTVTALRTWTPERIAQAIAALASSSGTGSKAVYIAAAHNAVGGEVIYVNKASAYTITFPASPVDGDFITLIYYTGSPSNSIALDFQGKDVNDSSSAGLTFDAPLEILFLGWSTAQNSWYLEAILETAELPATPSLTQTTEMIAGFIGTPANKDYRIVVKMAHGGTITETTTRSVSGTCTATFKVNSTALGGTANSVSSTEQSQAHASANTFAAGDDIVITVSANSSCVDISFSIKYTRTLE